jgi:signal transduction histidine kinase
MDEKLLPKHFGFAKWLIKLRWIALLLLVSSTFFVTTVLKISIQETPVYFLSFILFLLNCFYLLLVKLLAKKETQKIISGIRKILHFQIAADLVILTIILHFSGGIENPFIIYYIFHMIIVSSVLSPFESYVQTSFALLLVAALAFLECFSVIPHYPLTGFISQGFYQNKLYIAGTGFIFATTSYIVVGMTNSIVAKSRRNEEAYMKANLELEQKDVLKNEYVLHVTHDIKGHLGAIQSCIKVLKTNILGPLNEKQEEFVSRAYERTDLLTNFVKDLLNLTKKRLENNNNEPEEFSIKDLINKIVSEAKLNADEKAITIDVSIDNTIDKLKGNPFTIEELFSNILLNAIKYTPENGNVKLNVKNRPDHIIAEISDTGVGIPEEDISKVFDEFFRASNVKNDTKAGSGLGLAIAKQIVTSHNGRIWVESKLGTGSKFTFTLSKA